MSEKRFLTFQRESSSSACQMSEAAFSKAAGPVPALFAKTWWRGRQFGCNVCGEGGEYETFTLDCPMFPRRRIVLDAWEARAPAPSCLEACLTGCSAI